MMVVRNYIIVKEYSQKEFDSVMEYHNRTLSLDEEYRSSPDLYVFVQTWDSNLDSPKMQVIKLMDL